MGGKAVIISAGFRENGAAGLALEQVSHSKRAKGMRIIGPNCLGVMNPLIGLNATFAGSMGCHGHCGFISQIRRALHRDPRLELHANRSASVPSSRSARCSTSAGAT